MFRYLFNHHKWKPTKIEWIRAMAAVRSIEQERILNFAYKSDCRAALIGQLLIEKVIRNELEVDRNEVSISRQNGRPYLSYPKIPFDFNLSHDGHLTVLTCSKFLKTGVDVVYMRRKIGNVKDYLKRMSRVMTNSELETILRPMNDENKLRIFYRHWCLKEAYSKTLGSGLSEEFEKIECKLGDGNVDPWCGKKIDNDKIWAFEEHVLNGDHVCAVAWHGDDARKLNDAVATFVELTFDDLIVESRLVSTLNKINWEEYNKKSEKFF
uniref:L-aminoadipate-semialdehyde dehydrogenase-phosphopantetheinyl transferase n=1 Tax=Lepeophtheirus salmonis TaxID=72036 RepID=D3PJR0_LEPSM|nr:L-aminoadipate-semialdehyde dehydrogenase-phosphopantetheinyl transferase [Lepeophtheirus salmonis]